MNGKDLLLSKAFWGQIIGAFALIMAHYGMTIDVTNTAANIVGVLGLIIGVAGTIVRQSQIHSVMGIPLPAKKAATPDATKSTGTGA
jgi:hypothetical protein